MKHLLNTLFVTPEDAYAALDGDNVVIRQGENIVGRFPLHILEGIHLFSYAGASPALMGKCAREGIDLVFLTPRGRFLARTCGASRGNVLLRRTQYRIADDPSQSCRVARMFLFGKLSNARQVLDRVNALLSFVYTMLGSDCASALEAVGLDAYVGFLHRDRPGRTSLAQDLLEELRPCVADRFVLTLLNNGIMAPEDFQQQENGAVLLTPEGRRKVQQEWQNKKRQTITHPFLKEQIEWGLVPHVQALLLARCLRGDLDAYPPFLWK